MKKRQDLLASLDAEDFDAQCTLAQPDATNRYSFRPSDVGAHYLAWAMLTGTLRRSSIIRAYGDAWFCIDNNQCRCIACKDGEVLGWKCFRRRDALTEPGTNGQVC
ncbi:MAG: hypothetical protein WKF84_24560 [Pyrinomonadaceae bacterium]